MVLPSGKILPVQLRAQLNLEAFEIASLILVLLLDAIQFPTVSHDHNEYACFRQSAAQRNLEACEAAAEMFELLLEIMQVPMAAGSGCRRWSHDQIGYSLRYPTMPGNFSSVTGG